MKLLNVFFITSIGFVSSNAFCGEGMVYFQGSLSSDSCSINTSDANQEVNLGSVASATFHSAGDKSEAISFSINMTNCPETMSSTQMKFDGKSDQNNTDLLAIDSESSAQFVGIGIEESDGTLLPLHMASKTTDIDKNSHSVQMVYQARYIATSEAVSPGVANGVSQFSVNYN